MTTVDQDLAYIPEKDRHACRTLFDMKSEDGVVNFDGVMFILQALCLNPTREDIKRRYEDNNKDEKAGITLKDFCRMMGDVIQERDRANEELQESVHQLFVEDPVSFGELRKVLTNMGDEPLSREECEEIIADMMESNKGGKIKHIDLVNFLQKDPKYLGLSAEPQEVDRKFETVTKGTTKGQDRKGAGSPVDPKHNTEAPTVETLLSDDENF